MIELLGAGALVASGWIAAFVASWILRGSERDHATTRISLSETRGELEATRARLAREAEQHEHWRSEAARILAELADCEAERIDSADVEDLARLSSRGGPGAGRVLPEAGGGDDADRGRGPVPAWLIRDPGDPDVSGGGS